MKKDMKPESLEAVHTHTQAFSSEKLKLRSLDIVSENIKKIEKMFPNCVTETEDGMKIEFDMLKQELSNDIVDENKERYQLTWPGKKEAILLANAPTNKTLRPVGEKSIDFDNTKNIYIEGDNLEVLKILQESYLNKIDMIYIDPPYNTGNDFIYNDNFFKKKKQELIDSGVLDEDGNYLLNDLNTGANGEFHSEWLKMMYPRLKLARNLLSDDGVICISIDENEQANLKKICDEIFNEKNLIANLAVEMSKTQGMKVKAAQEGQIVKNHEYVYIYAKNKNSLKKRTPLYDEAELYDEHFDIILDNNEVIKLMDYLSKDGISSEKFKNYNLEFSKRNVKKLMEFDEGFKKYMYSEVATKLYRVSMISSKEIQKLNIPIGEIVKKDGYLLRKNAFGTVEQLQSFKDTLHVSDEYNPEYRRTTIRGALWKGFYSDMMNVVKEGNTEFKNGKKPLRLIKQLIKWANVKNGIVLDFFSGSGTTAHSVLKDNSETNNNNKYILVQLPEKIDEKINTTICDLAESRIKKSVEQIKKEAKYKIDYGFRVYKVDSSNMKDVYYIPTDLKQSQLNIFESNIKEERTAEDLLTQVILDLGLTLDLSIEERKIINNNVYFVEKNSLVACFDDTIDINIVDEICKCKPLKIVFKESSFKTDSDKINFFERIKKLSSESEVSVI